MSDQPPVNVNVNHPAEPAARIGITQVYTETLRANESNARIEGKVDRIIDKVDGLAGQVADHENRLRLLESTALSKRTVAAIVTTAGVLTGSVATLLALIIRH